MRLLFSPSVLLFLGPSLPVVDSYLAALVSEGLKFILPKKESDPDVKAGKISTV